MPLDEDLRHAFDRAAAELRTRFDASIAALADELSRLMAAERGRLSQEADRRVAAAQQQAEAQVSAFRQQAESQVEEVRRQAEAQVADVRVAAERQVADVRRQAESQVAALKEQARRQVEELRHAADTQVADLRRALDEMRVATQKQIEEVRRAANADAEDLVVSQLAAAAADNDRRTEEAVAQTRAEAQAETNAAAARLVESVRALDNARTLGELLDYLVESAGREAERAAVFVTKGDRLQGWRLVGFGPDLPPAKTIDLSPRELEPPPFARTTEARDFVTLPIQVGGAPVAVLYADTTAARGDLVRLRAVLEVWARYVGRALEAMTATRATGLMLPRPMARASQTPPDPPHPGAATRIQ